MVVSINVKGAGERRKTQRLRFTWESITCYGAWSVSGKNIAKSRFALWHRLFASLFNFGVSRNPKLLTTRVLKYYLHRKFSLWE